MPEAKGTISELRDELIRFEAEARRASLTEISIRTHVDRVERFVRCLAGDFQCHGPR